MVVGGRSTVTISDSNLNILVQSMCSGQPCPAAYFVYSSSTIASLQVPWALSEAQVCAKTDACPSGTHAHICMFLCGCPCRPGCSGLDHSKSRKWRCADEHTRTFYPKEQKICVTDPSSSSVTQLIVGAVLGALLALVLALGLYYMVKHPHKVRQLLVRFVKEELRLAAMALMEVWVSPVKAKTN